MSPHEAHFIDIRKSYTAQSGNAGTEKNGDPVIFDPAGYYGHNEAEYVPRLRYNHLTLTSGNLFLVATSQ